MLAGSASTSMRGAFQKFQARPNTMQMQAPQHSVKAGFQDPALAAKAEMSTDNLDLLLGGASAIFDAYTKFKRIDEEAQAETMYLEYREKMSEWTVNKNQTVKTFNEQNGTFEWETLDSDYEDYSRGVWEQLEGKYDISSKDLKHELTMKRRNNDLTQVENLREFQNKHRTARITGNYELRKDRAFKYGTYEEYKQSLDWGLQNGMYASKDQYDYEVGESRKQFNFRDQARLTEDMGQASTREMLNALEFRREDQAKRYGRENLADLEKMTFSRAVELQVANMSSHVNHFQTRTELNQYYNDMKTKSPAELGVATEAQKLDLLTKLSTAKNRYEEGMAKVTTQSKEQARNNAYQNHAAAVVNELRKPQSLVIDRPSIPLQDAEGNGALLDMETGSITTDLDTLTQDMAKKTYRPPVETDKDMLKGYDNAYRQEAGEHFVIPETGEARTKINVHDQKSHSIAQEYLTASGQLPKSYVDAVGNAIYGSPRESAVIVMQFAQVVDSDPTGRIYNSLPDGELKSATLTALSVMENPSAYGNAMDIMEQRMGMSATATNSFEQTWDTNVTTKEPIPKQVLDVAYKKLGELGIGRDQVPQAYLDDLAGEARTQYVTGAGLGDFNRSAHAAAASVNARWGLQLGQSGQYEMKEYSYYAYHGDPTGKDPFVTDKLITATAETLGIPWEEAASYKLRPVFSGTKTNPKWNIEMESEGGWFTVGNASGAVSVTQDSPATRHEMVRQASFEDSAFTAAENSVKAGNDAYNATKPLNKRIDTALRYIVPKIEEFGEEVVLNDVTMTALGTLLNASPVGLFREMMKFPAAAKKFAESELTEDELDRMAENAAHGVAGNVNYSYLPENQKEWLGGTAHAIYKRQQAELMRSTRMTQEIFDKNIADHRTYLNGIGLVIPE
jgi:hypothetical protein